MLSFAFLIRNRCDDLLKLTKDILSSHKWTLIFLEERILYIVKYMLQDYDRGVNWTLFHPTWLLIVSRASDRQVIMNGTCIAWSISLSIHRSIDCFFILFLLNYGPRTPIIHQRMQPCFAYTQSRKTSLCRRTTRQPHKGAVTPFTSELEEQVDHKLEIIWSRWAKIVGNMGHAW